jgi:hypothetical protein
MSYNIMIGYDIYDCFTVEDFPLRQKITLTTKMYCSRLYHVLLVQLIIILVSTVLFGKSFSGNSGGNVAITSIHQHPYYNPQLDLDYDISLLHVASPFPLSSNVAIIGLPSSTTSWPPGTSALVSGLGKVDETSKSSR